MNKVFVLGGAQTDFERNWSKEGKNVIALLREVIEDGLRDCDLSYSDIENLNKENKVACYVGNFVAEKYIEQGHLGALLTEVNPAFYGVPSARYEAACASGSVALDAAMTKIQTGEYDVALVIGFELMKTVSPKIGGDYLGYAAYYEQEGRNIDFPFPKLFGRLADEILEKYHLDEKVFMESLATISAKNYANAKSNPLSQTRKWFMSETQANMRGCETNSIVGGRLAVSDCSQVTDGAAMVVLVSENYLQKRELKDKPYIKGYGHRVAPMLFDKKMRESKENPYILPWTRQAVLDAYRRAKITLKDIDFFETHDCFTSSEYAAVSAFGITDPGEEFRAVLEGITQKDGKYPINLSGGLIGCGHPVGASGVRMFLDLYKQVTKQAGSYQKQGKAENGCMLNIGGSATTNYVFILGN
ncbi:acetyl-CoA acetyltransferase [Mediterraneibacter massiliensis]|uniref:acetyl-CoA acetyltransferase n=1 Tax=Mediterraneibacter massiliensis TaxID=1720300 RepID=UPI0024ACB75B|nr:acetyl-CoA acetyltransferase [Mediterraneibacter massiliensis]